MASALDDRRCPRSTSSPRRGARQARPGEHTGPQPAKVLNHGFAGGGGLDVIIVLTGTRRLEARHGAIELTIGLWRASTTRAEGLLAFLAFRVARRPPDPWRRRTLSRYPDILAPPMQGRGHARRDPFHGRSTST